jgi:hypothetical protein
MPELEVRYVNNGHAIAGFCGTYFYRLPTGAQFLFFDVDVAWCWGCEEFVLVERLQSEQSIQAEVERLAACRAEWPALDEKIRAEWPEIERLSKEKNLPLLNSFFHEHQYKMAVTILAWRQSRKSPPHCLMCGSITGIRILPQDDEFEHPVGRGKLRITTGTFDLGGHYYLDGEGNWLEGPISD